MWSGNSPDFCVHAKLLQSFLTLCSPVDCRPLGFSVPGTLQARIRSGLPSSREISPTQGSNPCLLWLLHWQAGSSPLVTPRKPLLTSRTRNMWSGKGPASSHDCPTILCWCFGPEGAYLPLLYPGGAHLPPASILPHFQTYNVVTGIKTGWCWWRTQRSMEQRRQLRNSLIQA